YGLVRSGVGDRPTGGTELSAATVEAATAGARFDLRALAEVDTRRHPKNHRGQDGPYRKDCPRFSPRTEQSSTQSSPRTVSEPCGGCSLPCCEKLSSHGPSRGHDRFPRGKAV